MVTAWVVLAEASSATTYSWLLSALVSVDAFCTLLYKSAWAVTFEGSNSVDTEVLAVVLFGCTLIEIDTSFAITVQLVTWWADTFVASWCITAIEAARRLSSNTFVDVATSLLGSAWNKTMITGASETTKGVDTFAVGTEVGCV
jgi:hypothetical protein